MGSAELFFFSSLFLSLGGVDIHTSCGKVEGLYIVLDTVHSTPPPIHGPSFSHSVAFSLDHHTHAHTINYTLYSPSLSFTHILSIVLPRSLPRLSTRLTDIFFSSFSPFSSFTLSRSYLSRSHHIQQHLNIVFSVIIKRNNDNI